MNVMLALYIYTVWIYVIYVLEILCIYVTIIIKICVNLKKNFVKIESF